MNKLKQLEQGLLQLFAPLERFSHRYLLGPIRLMKSASKSYRIIPSLFWV